MDARRGCIRRLQSVELEANGLEDSATPTLSVPPDESEPVLRDEDEEFLRRFTIMEPRSVFSH